MNSENTNNDTDQAVVYYVENNNLTKIIENFDEILIDYYGDQVRDITIFKPPCLINNADGYMFQYKYSPDWQSQFGGTVKVYIQNAAILYYNKPNKNKYLLLVDERIDEIFNEYLTKKSIVFKKIPKQVVCKPKSFAKKIDKMYQDFLNA